MCVSENQRRVKATQINCEWKVRLVFLVPACLKKVGRALVNSSVLVELSTRNGLCALDLI